MDVTTILAKDPTAVSTEEKAFLAEHRNELTGDQIEAFGVTEVVAPVVETPVVPAAEAPAPVVVAEPVVVADQDATAIQASIKAGTTVLVEASSYNGLIARVEASEKKIASYERAKIEASVDEAIKRGAIKADKKKDWADKIEADRSLETLIATLPGNSILASEIGKDEVGTGASASVQLEEKIRAEMKASNSEYGVALTKVMADNTELAIERNKEFKG